MLVTGKISEKKIVACWRLKLNQKKEGCNHAAGINTEKKGASFMLKINQKRDNTWLMLIKTLEKTAGVQLYAEQISAAATLAGVGEQKNNYNYPIIEMATGEGKTFVGMLALAYLIKTRKVERAWLVTTNEYLARRDCIEASSFYDNLGINAGFISAKMSLPEKQENYHKDIIYTSDENLGFDYLRDCSADNQDQIRLPKLTFALVDECDNILLDNARTPLILSAKPISQADNNLTLLADRFVCLLKESDYLIEKDKNICYLTETGEKKAVNFIQMHDEIENKSEFITAVNIALQAHFIMIKDKDYIVKNKKIVLINQDTGRLARSRQYMNGLTQALEAKEYLPFTQDSETTQEITYQNLFSLFDNFAGMTGTALSSKKEFKQLYHKRVVPIKRHFKNHRIDAPDKVYLTQQQRDQAVLKDIKETHAKKIPLLIQTPDIKTNISFGKFLTKNKIKYQLLNALTISDDQEDSYLKESKIVSQIGKPGQITLATNVAGRGTDIKLIDGAKELRVIGISRSRNKRLDQQFIGRSGRQNNRGSSQFYLSLDDDLIQTFARNGILRNIANLRIKAQKDIKPDGLLKNKYARLIKQAQAKQTDYDLTSRFFLAEYEETNEALREKICFLKNRLRDPESRTSVLKALVYQGLSAKQLVATTQSERALFLNLLNENAKLKDVDLDTDFKSVQNKYLYSTDFYKSKTNGHIELINFKLSLSNALNKIDYSDFELAKVAEDELDYLQIELIKIQKIIQLRTQYYSFVSIKPVNAYTEQMFEEYQKLYENTCYQILVKIAIG